MAYLIFLRQTRVSCPGILVVRASTDDGRKVIADTSNILQDGLVTRIDENMRSGNIKYHLSCYKTYKNKGERQIANQQKRKNTVRRMRNQPPTTSTPHSTTN